MLWLHPHCLLCTEVNHVIFSVMLKCEQKGGERLALKSCLHQRSLPLQSRSHLSALFYTMCIQCSRVTLYMLVSLCLFLLTFRHRSCTWTFAPRWTLRGKETAAHVRFPPTAPGSPPTQRCQILHVSHLLFPKVLTHSTAGQCGKNSCIHMNSIAVNETNWKNVTSSTVS